MGTSVSRASAKTEFYSRGDYLPGIWVDGMDIFAVKSAVEFAMEFCKKCVPIVLEFNTYRYFGHSMSDPGKSYRNREEVETMRRDYDPILALKNVMVKHQLATEEELKEIDDKVKKTVDEVVKIAKEDPEPPLDELVADTYFQPLTETERGARGQRLKSKMVAKRLEDQLIPPKDKPNFEGFAFAHKTSAGKEDEKEKAGEGAEEKEAGKKDVEKTEAEGKESVGRAEDKKDATVVEQKKTEESKTEKSNTEKEKNKAEVKDGTGKGEKKDGKGKTENKDSSVTGNPGKEGKP